MKVHKHRPVYNEFEKLLLENGFENVCVYLWENMNTIFVTLEKEGFQFVVKYNLNECTIKVFWKDSGQAQNDLIDAIYFINKTARENEISQKILQLFGVNKETSKAGK